MKENELSIDDILADVNALLDGKSERNAASEASTEPAAEAKEEEKKPEEKKDNKKKSHKKGKRNNKKGKKKSKGGKFWRILGRIFLFLLVTVLILVMTLYGVMYVLAKGPSETARDLFVMSVRETSAVGWIANIFFSDEEIAAIENKQTVEDFIETDTSLIQFPTEPAAEEDASSEAGPKPDAWGLVDEDGDGIILEEVKGEGYSGYMMIVLDPSRVIVGSVPESYGARGYTVEEMVKKFDAVAGTNAGGFYDPDGKGNGSIPDTMVVFEGEVYYAGNGTRQGFVGMDKNHILHVTHGITKAEIAEKEIQYGVCFGPVLISNGEPCVMNASGVNPRTAIGQRSDGAILMLVIDGRQVISMGATMQDLVDIMLDYGAVNACNLDGGSSTLMWYEDDYVNNCASVIGIRPVPTAILVLKEGVNGND